jgi:hypothetical protein
VKVLDIFSKRQRRLRGETPDVYVYDAVPHQLRVQIIHIWNDVLGGPEAYKDEFFGPETRDCYKGIVEILRREYGVFQLPPGQSTSWHHMKELAEFLLQEKDVERVLDAVEVSFRLIDLVVRDRSPLNIYPPGPAADSAIEELNTRLREHGVGYYFSSGEIIRIDSELIHAEAVKPALRLLSQPWLEGAQQEFLSAHGHYRAGRFKEALADALRSLESTLKSVCAKRHWAVPRNATSSTLIDVCLKHGLIPEMWQSQFGGLRSILEGGVPPARNRLGGHGQGSEVQTVPQHIVAYVLHMTAATIVFLAESEASL